MTSAMTFRLGVAAVVAAALLTGCATGAPVPDPTETELYGAEGPGSPGDGGAATGGGGSSDGPLSAEGMPLNGALVGCADLVDATVTESDFDIQWRWEFECSSRDAFDASIAALDGTSWLTRTAEQELGTASYIRDLHHWIGEQSGVVDVDLTAKGSPDDLEVVYLVTQRTDG